MDGGNGGIGCMYAYSLVWGMLWRNIMDMANGVIIMIEMMVACGRKRAVRRSASSARKTQDFLHSFRRAGFCVCLWLYLTFAGCCGQPGMLICLECGTKPLALDAFLVPQTSQP
jgi:hypothetical protein